MAKPDAAANAEFLDVQVCIVGAGISGICVARGLEADAVAGGAASYTLLEASADLGGTWSGAAGYPGAACDVPSHLYSFSFALNAGWTRKFAPAGEILEYLRDVAKRFGVAPRVRCGLRVQSAVWSASEGRWEVLALPSGAVAGARAVRVRSRFLVSAVGALCVPALPAIAGAGMPGAFAGTSAHSAAWPRGLSLAGKRVAVIGSGASAAQLVPAAAREAASLVVFQRTPSWVVPRRDAAWPAAVRWLLALCPPLLWAYHMLLFAVLDAQYYALIEPLACLRPVAAWLARRHLRAQVRDEALRAALAPPYAIGCKRVLLSDDFYPALCAPHVKLVTAPVAAITPAGVRTADGAEHAVDVLVYATGFDVVGSVAALDVRGAGGADLRSRLKAGAASYLGLAFADFPNFFMCVGPNTGLGHNSIIAMIECQARFIRACVARAVAAGPRASLAPRARAQEAWADATQARLRGTVWAGCNSWYNNQGGKNITMWPGTVTQYWWATLWPRWADFDERNPEDGAKED